MTWNIFYLFSEPAWAKALSSLLYWACLGLVFEVLPSTLPTQICLWCSKGGAFTAPDSSFSCGLSLLLWRLGEVTIWTTLRLLSHFGGRNKSLGCSVSWLTAVCTGVQAAFVLGRAGESEGCTSSVMLEANSVSIAVHQQNHDICGGVSQMEDTYIQPRWKQKICSSIYIEETQRKYLETISYSLYCYSFQWRPFIWPS